MTIKEKEERTSPQSMRDRRIVVHEFKKRILCINEFPHNDRLLPQYVLWAKYPRMNKALYNSDFANIIDYIDTILYENDKEYRIERHARSEKSVTFREHRHIYPVAI